MWESNPRRLHYARELNAQPFSQLATRYLVVHNIYYS